MATKTQEAGALDGALNLLQEELGAQPGDFSLKAEICLDLLDLSLDCLAGLGLLSRVAVEVQAQTSEGMRFVQKYSMGFRKEVGDNGEEAEVPYLKKSILKEDE